MRKRRILWLLALACSIFIMCNIAFAGEDSFTISSESATAGKEYVLIITSGERDKLELVDNDDSIVYISQQTATSSTIVFEEVKPASFDVATAFIIDEDGVLVKREVLNSTSVIVNDGWVNLANGAKGYGRNGSLVKGWLTLDGQKYWFDENGAAASGWTEVDGLTYYFRPGDYRMAKGWATIDGSKTLFRTDGRLADGWVTNDGASYYADGGVPRSGWQEINGTRYYFREDGTYRMASGWATVSGKKYLFRADGRIADGWVTLNGANYYADAGIPREGWQEIEGKKRYFRLATDYRMATGWTTIGGYTYWFDSAGNMATGKKVIDGKTYTFGQDGRLQTSLSAQSENESLSDGNEGSTEESHDEEIVVVESVSEPEADSEGGEPTGEADDR